jgi:hypothetical protein
MFRLGERSNHLSPSARRYNKTYTRDAQAARNRRGGEPTEITLVGSRKSRTPRPTTCILSEGRQTQPQQSSEEPWLVATRRDKQAILVRFPSTPVKVGEKRGSRHTYIAPHACHISQICHIGVPPQLTSFLLSRPVFDDKTSGWVIGLSAPPPCLWPCTLRGEPQGQCR